MFLIQRLEGHDKAKKKVCYLFMTVTTAFSGKYFQSSECVGMGPMDTEGCMSSTEHDFYPTILSNAMMNTTTGSNLRKKGYKELTSPQHSLSWREVGAATLAGAEAGTMDQSC